MIQNNNQERGANVPHRERTVIISLIIAVIVFLAVFTIFIIKNREIYISSGDKFIVTIESPSVNYQIMLPIPLEQNRSPWYLLDSLTVTRGNATFSIIDTAKGQMLSIESNESATLYAKTNPRDIAYLAVSPQNVSGQLRREGNIPYLVFLNASNRSLEINFSYEAISYDPGSGDYVTQIIVSSGMENGWMEIWGWASHIVE